MPSSDVNRRLSRWFYSVGLLVSLVAAAIAFLPFAFNTSPWDTLMLNVPGNQGNWWHALIGFPFFLAFPMIWLYSRSFRSERALSVIANRILWTLVGASIIGTILVEVPFVLGRAGTSEAQRLSIVLCGFGLMIAGGVVLSAKRRSLATTQAALVGVTAAYLANASLCLIVYAGASGPLSSRIGWLVAVLIVWPMMFEVLWISTTAKKRVEG